MKLHLHRYTTHFILYLTLSLCVISCTKDEVEPTANTLTSDGIYTFKRDGDLTVRNNGQVVRNLLLQDFSIRLKELQSDNAPSVDYQSLYSYYDNGGVTISGSTLTPVTNELLFPTLSEISGNRDLAFRVNPEFKSVIEERISKSCHSIVANTKNAELTGTKNVLIDQATGIHLGELIHKTLLGGVLWSHGINTYLVEVEKMNNTDLVNNGVFDLPYTEMEHHFDEAYGYFGSPRNVDSYSLEELADSNLLQNYQDNFKKDGKIDFKTEYSFTFSRLTAQRDLGSSGETDFYLTLLNAFFNGRSAIVNNDMITLKNQKEIILGTYEEIIGASAIHHINQLILLLEQDSQINSYDFSSQWTQTLCFLEMFRYNYYYNSIENWDEYINDYLSDPKTLLASEELNSKVDLLNICRTDLALSLGLNTYNFKDW